ncbi:MAG: hypothetical protein ACREBG_09855 [Pyrinomonadaceae bacterium]
MQRRRSHTVSILLGTSAKTALPGDPFRLGRIRLSRVLWLSVLMVMLGGLLEPEAAAQTVSFGAKTDFGTGARSRSVAWAISMAMASSIWRWRTLVRFLLTIPVPRPSRFC